MVQERLNALAVISIEVEEAKKLEIDKIIDIFAKKNELKQFGCNINCVCLHLFSILTVMNYVVVVVVVVVVAVV